MQTPWARHEDAAKTQWCLHRLCEVSVQTQNASSGVLAATICVLTAHPAFPWRSGRPQCVATAPPLRPHGVPTARIQIEVGTPSNGAHFVLAQSARRGMASKETPRRPAEMSRPCHGTLVDPTARTSAFWNFLGRRAIAVRTPHWCGRGLTTTWRRKEPGH